MSALFDGDSLAIACIWAEARGEPFEGQCAVGEVILRRMVIKLQSDGSITGTVLWPWAFSWANTNSPERLATFKLDSGNLGRCAEAWEAAKNGSKYAGGADSYFNPSLATPSWAAKATKVTSIGHHDFYRVRL